MWRVLYTSCVSRIDFVIVIKYIKVQSPLNRNHKLFLIFFLKNVDFGKNGEMSFFTIKSYLVLKNCHRNQFLWRSVN